MTAIRTWIQIFHKISVRSMLNKTENKFVHWRCRLFLAFTRPYFTSCHGTAEIAKYKACDSNQNNCRNYRRKQYKLATKSDNLHFLWASPGLISRFQHLEGKSGLSKNKLSAYRQTTHKLRRAHGRKITWPAQGGYRGAQNSELPLTNKNNNNNNNNNDNNDKDNL